jgi:hypothetical protein
LAESHPGKQETKKESVAIFCKNIWRKATQESRKQKRNQSLSFVKIMADFKMFQVIVADWNGLLLST